MLSALQAAALIALDRDFLASSFRRYGGSLLVVPALIYRVVLRPKDAVIHAHVIVGLTGTCAAVLRCRLGHRYLRRLQQDAGNWYANAKWGTMAHPRVLKAGLRAPNMRACLTKVDFERSANGVLDVAAMGVVQEHLDSCPSCRAAYGEYSRMRAAEGIPPDAKEAADNAQTDAGSDVSLEGKAAVVGIGDTTIAVDTAALNRPLETVADSALARKATKHFPKIEGYEIVDVLGQGGMGIVYRARQTKLNRIVALKVLPAVMGSASSAAVSRFRSEATAAARLHHTNIVPVYDYGESSDAYYYAMELIIGKPMDEIIRQLSEKSVAAVSVRDLGTLVREFLVDQTWC